jgi:hypothetical protein
LAALAFALSLTGLVAAKPPAFQAGAHAVDISPTNFPVVVNAMFTERAADKVVDRLHAKALVLDDGRTRVALCVVDSCMVPRDLCDRAKSLAAKPAGIRPEHMLVSATHTHSAPSAMACLGSRVDAAYAAALPARVADAIAGAVARLQPARIGWAMVDDWEHTFNRRWIRRPDRLLTDPFGAPTVRAHMHPGYQSPEAIGPSGPVDPGLSVLAVQTRDGRPLALLANYSQHYYGSPLLSSDYYGRFAVHVARRLGVESGDPPFVGIMSQGTSGDLMWMDYGSPARDIGYDAYAAELAARAAELYLSMDWRDQAPLRMAERTLSLRRRAPDEARLAWARATVRALDGRLPQTLPEIYAWEAVYLHERPQAELKLQALRIGDLGITAIPNEVFALTGLKLKALSPLKTTFNIGLANGAEGYIPPPEQHQLGGYTTWPARTAGLEVQAEPRIVEAALRLLEKVAGRPRRRVVDQHGPYATAVLASRPVAYWRLDEMNPPIARDATGRGYSAQYEDGVAVYLPGVGSGHGRRPEPQLTPSSFSGSQINRAAHFAGGRLQAKLPPLGEAYSLELWLWNGLASDARPVTGWFFSQGPEGGSAALDDHAGIGGTEPGDRAGRLIVANGRHTLVGRTVLDLRKWHHVVVVRDGGTVTVYLDGQLDARGELEPTTPRRVARVFVGGRSDRTDSFEGRLDEVALYQRALAPEEVAAHYRISGLAKGLVRSPGTAGGRRPYTVAAGDTRRGPNAPAFGEELPQDRLSLSLSAPVPTSAP